MAPSMKLKALTLWEPWASLIMVGAKTYETRSWATPYRGPLVIHASLNKDSIGMIRDGRVYDLLFEVGITKMGDFKLGYALCVCTLVDCIPTNKLDVSQLSRDDWAFGDYRPERYAWKLANVQRLDPPIKVRGYQGLWDWPETLEFSLAPG